MSSFSFSAWTDRQRQAVAHTGTRTDASSKTTCFAIMAGVHVIKTTDYIYVRRGLVLTYLIIYYESPYYVMCSLSQKMSVHHRQ